jgi:hypothetical protein
VTFYFDKFYRKTLPPHAEGFKINLLRQLDWDTPKNAVQQLADLPTTDKGFFAPNTRNRETHDLKVGPGAVSWKSYGVDLHMLEKA